MASEPSSDPLPPRLDMPYATLAEWEAAVTEARSRRRDGRAPRPSRLVPGGRLPGGGRALVPRMPCACVWCDECGYRICVAASFAMCMGEYDGRREVCACPHTQAGTPPSPWG